jgi:hypothetical protein
LPRLRVRQNQNALDRVGRASFNCLQQTHGVIKLSGDERTGMEDEDFTPRPMRSLGSRKAPA